MAKDPAFLFYPNDFTSGTRFMTDEQVGKYIRLLCAQFDCGHLTEEQMIMICKSYDNHIFSKFIKDSEGKFYNERLEIEKFKRKNFCKSRGKNREGKKKTSNSYDSHMENENEDVNESVDSSNNTTKPKRSNLDFANQYRETRTQIEKGIKVLRANNLRSDEDNLLHLLSSFTEIQDHNGIAKNNFNEFASHFCNWIGTSGVKYSLKKKAW